jgi:hypothetical protein
LHDRTLNNLYRTESEKNMGIPIRATRDELALVERAGGTDSIAFQRVKEQVEAWEAHLTANKTEDDRLRAEHERKLAAVDRERDAAREVERAAAEAQLREDIRAAFFAGSPSVTNAEFEALYPRLREERLLLFARRNLVQEEAAALAQTVPAGYRGTW